MSERLAHALDGRHSSTQQVARWFTFDHLVNGAARRMSAQFHGLAIALIEELPDSPELTVALRKLLESKDAAVRCVIDSQQIENGASS